MKQSVAGCMALVLSFTGFGFGASLKGTVQNLTTGRPAAGDVVLFLSLSDSMKEMAHTATEAGGGFAADVADAQGPVLVRVLHQGVAYHAIAQPGTEPVNIGVYDVSRTKLKEVSAVMDIQRYQATGETLSISEVFVLRNASDPPLTMMNDRPFEIYLPADASLIGSMVKSGEAQPVTVTPLPAGEPGHYFFKFPIRPGETRFQFNYRMPYRNTKTIRARASLPVTQFLVVLPASMKFDATDTSAFQQTSDIPKVMVQESKQLIPGQDLVFRISGAGTLPRIQANSTSAPRGEASDTRPGGGLGVPVDGTDPLHEWRWHILGGLALLLTLGGVFVTVRSGVPRPSPQVSDRQKSARALAALKDELFRLEMRKQQGRMSAQEYARAKDNLDGAIQRAIAAAPRPTSQPRRAPKQKVA